ncbi:hypothetical protein LRM35_27520 [Klebsiella variicola subsp. variicola]|nr:hypothetical protein LRM35_27520 [Klebsiella variicola subsp. variicola]
MTTQCLASSDAGHFVPQEFQGNETREGVVSDRRTVFIILQSQQKQ